MMMMMMMMTKMAIETSVSYRHLTRLIARKVSSNTSYMPELSEMYLFQYITFCNMRNSDIRVQLPWVRPWGLFISQLSSEI